MDTPQFETAKYTGSNQNVCKRCSQTVGDTYYRVSGDIACAPCGEKAKLEQPEDSHAAFMRALLFGIGAAIVGLALYAAFAIATGLVIGYAALAVGFIIAKAMKAGSKGLGGHRYQIAAALLTYIAVSMAAIPIGISQIIKQREARAHTQAQPSTTSETEATPEEAGDEPAPQPVRRSVNWSSVIGSLLFAGLASPFLDLQDPLHGLIGLIILSVGIRIAWRMTADDPARHGVVGPFRNTTPAAAPVAST
jgi:uncharacterized protein (DUF983 family)